MQKKETDSLIMFSGGVLEKGYGIVAKTAMQDVNLHKYSKLLYAYLCTYGTGAFPSRSLIMLHLGMGKTSFQIYMRQLKEYGYITSKQEISNGQFGRNVYTIEQTITPAETITPLPIKNKKDDPGTGARATDKKEKLDKKPRPGARYTASQDTAKQTTNNTSSNITNPNNTIAAAATDLPKGITQKHVAELTAEYADFPDRVSRQLKNLQIEMTMKKIKSAIAWLRDACREDYDDREIDLHVADSPELIAAKEKFKQNKLKLVPVEKDYDLPQTENFEFLKAFADRAQRG